MICPYVGCFVCFFGGVLVVYYSGEHDFRFFLDRCLCKFRFFVLCLAIYGVVSGFYDHLVYVGSTVGEFGFFCVSCVFIR